MSRTKYEGEPGTEGQLKEFAVVVEWKMRGIKRVRARSLKEAADMTADLELPRGEYVDDSFEPDIQDSDSGYERTCDADEKPSVNIAATPVDEPCEQCGTPNYNPNKAQFECQVFIDQLIRQFGPEPQGARLFVKRNEHDAGTYYEVECAYDEEFPASFAYALQLEGNTPENWDQPAIDELNRRYPSVITNM